MKPFPEGRGLAGLRRGRSGPQSPQQVIEITSRLGRRHRAASDVGPPGRFPARQNGEHKSFPGRIVILGDHEFARMREILDGGGKERPLKVGDRAAGGEEPPVRIGMEGVVREGRNHPFGEEQGGIIGKTFAGPHSADATARKGFVVFVSQGVANQFAPRRVEGKDGVPPVIDPEAIRQPGRAQQFGGQLPGEVQVIMLTEGEGLKPLPIRHHGPEIAMDGFKGRGVAPRRKATGRAKIAKPTANVAERTAVAALIEVDDAAMIPLVAETIVKPVPIAVGIALNGDLVAPATHDGHPLRGVFRVQNVTDARRVGGQRDAGFEVF